MGTWHRHPLRGLTGPLMDLTGDAGFVPTRMAALDDPTRHDLEPELSEVQHLCDRLRFVAPRLQYRAERKIAADEGRPLPAPPPTWPAAA
jgi:hypothetical protein